MAWQTVGIIYRGSSSFNRWAMTSCDGEADRGNDTLLSLLTAPAASYTTCRMFTMTTAALTALC